VRLLGRLARVAAACAVALGLAACSKPADDGVAGRPIAPPPGQAGAPAAVGGAIPSTLQVLPDGGDFTLTGVDGKPFALASLRGRPVVLFFGYTSCPDFCPRAMGTVRAALAKLDAAARTKVATVFVSVDPERDTPKALGRYLQSFGLGAIGATGTHDQLREIIKRYGADYERDPSATPQAYTVSHPTSLYVIGPNGRLRGLVSGADEVDELVAALRRVL
jgi:protein SCO1/2